MSERGFSCSIPLWGANGGPAAQPFREDLSDQFDGKKNDFTTSRNYVATTLEVWVNGLYLGVPPSEFAETGAAMFHLTTLTPNHGERLVVRYVQA